MISLRQIFAYFINFDPFRPREKNGDIKIYKMHLKRNAFLQTK